jgi:3'(2'), 5'-bisphosphate nucleotidase
MISPGNWVGDMKQYDAELRIALEAAELASKAILEQYAEFQAIPNAPANITTEVDRQAQAIILKILQATFPEDACCAEETTAAGTQVAGTGPRLWVVDPIDGTRGFARKNGEFSVMIAFVDKGLVAVGVVQEPAQQRLTFASKGGGCWRRDGNHASAKPCHVSTVTDLAEATLVQTRSRDPGKPTEEVCKLRPARVVETYSAGIKLAMVARGDVDTYVNNYTGMHDWDVCAGEILVTEAGGTVTGLGGEKLKYGTEGAWQRFGLLATNGRLHPLALQRLAKVV